PKNPSIIYHVQNGVLRQSTTGGGVNSWTTVLTVPFTLYFPFVIDSINTSRLLVGGLFPGAALQESLNQGTSWTNLSSNLPLGYSVTSLAIATYQGNFNSD